MANFPTAFCTMGTNVTYAVRAFTQPAIWTATSAGWTTLTWSPTMGAGSITGGVNSTVRLNPYIPLEQEARYVERQRQAAGRRTQRGGARTRARATLLEFLSPEQRTQYEEYEHFVVIGSEGGRYRIEPGSAGNVVYLDEHDDLVGRLCAHPSMRENLAARSGRRAGPDARADDRRTELRTDRQCVLRSEAVVRALGDVAWRGISPRERTPR
jgi:hypothetical protein